MKTFEPVSRRLDGGRLIMVPGAVLMLSVDAVVLVHWSGNEPLRWLGTVLVATFYVLIIWAYLRRGPAKATSRSLSAHAAAITATLLPFAIPVLAVGRTDAGPQLLADGLLALGTAWSVWSLQTLGRNLSVIAQARDVVDHGPYRWIRHPLYSGEIVSSLGLAITADSLPAAATWLLLVTLQVHRARHEERILLATLPAYAGYRTRTAALLPGVF